MRKAADVLISIKHCHAYKFRNGDKTVELRRRATRLSPGTRVWIYTKLPRGTVELIGIVEQVVRDSPSSLWRKVGKETGITKNEFTAYFHNKRKGCAIIFRKVKLLSPSIDLQKLRDVCSSFQPPQFLKILSTDSPELRILRASKRLPTIRSSGRGIPASR